MNQQTYQILAVIIGCFIILIVSIVVNLIRTNYNKVQNLDIRCQLTKSELAYIERIMSKYRCTFDELLLLGVWKFDDEGRNVFDLIDKRRGDFKQLDSNHMIAGQFDTFDISRTGDLTADYRYCSLIDDTAPQEISLTYVWITAVLFQMLLHQVVKGGHVDAYR